MLRVHSEVQTNHQSVAKRRLIHRIISSVPVGGFGVHRENDLHERRVSANPIDLVCSELWILNGHDHGTAQPWFVVQPIVELPIVNGTREGSRGEWVAHAL